MKIKIPVHKTILAVVLHGCETWYLTLKEKRVTFWGYKRVGCSGCRREKVIGDCREFVK
jgi:hypothetical protein